MTTIASIIIGNVYESKDHREQGRRVKVLRVDGRYAMCEPLNPKTRKRVAVTRISLLSLTTRWRCVMFDPPTKEGSS